MERRDTSPQPNDGRRKRARYQPTTDTRTTSAVSGPPREEATIDLAQPPTTRRTIHRSSGTRMPGSQMGLLERAQTATQSSRGRGGVIIPTDRVQTTSTVSRPPPDEAATDLAQAHTPRLAIYRSPSSGRIMIGRPIAPLQRQVIPQNNQKMIAEDHLRSPIQRPQSSQSLQVATNLDLEQPFISSQTTHRSSGTTMPGHQIGLLERTLESGQSSRGRGGIGNQQMRYTAPRAQATSTMSRPPPEGAAIDLSHSYRGRGGIGNQQIRHPAPRVQATSTVSRPPPEGAPIDLSQPHTSRSTIHPLEREVIPQQEVERPPFRLTSKRQRSILGGTLTSAQSSTVRTEIGNQQIRHPTPRVQASSIVRLPPPEGTALDLSQSYRGRGGVGYQQIRHPAPRVQATRTASRPPPEEAVGGVALGVVAGGVAGVGADVAAVQVVGFDNHDIDYLRTKTCVSAHYEILEQIATGSYGTVVRAVRPRSNTLFAIKILKPIGLKATEESIDYEVNELIPFVRLKFNTHENFVRIQEILADPNIDNRARYIVMELSTVGNLHTFITTSTEWLPMNEPNARYMMSGIGNAISDMHRRSIVHCDIRPQNVLLFYRPGEQPSIPGIEVSKYIPKICDFSKSLLRERESDEPLIMRATQRFADIHYSAPESGVQEVVKPYDLKKADSYSLGCTLLALLIGGHPFIPNNILNPTEQQIFDIKKDWFTNNMIDGYNLSNNLKHLLKQTIRVALTSRYTAGKFTNNVWFQ